MKQLFFVCSFYFFVIMICCGAKKLNLYTNYKEDLTNVFDYSLFQPYYKVKYEFIVL